MRLHLTVVAATFCTGMALIPPVSAQAEPVAPPADRILTAPLSFDCAWRPHPPPTSRVLVDLVLRRDATGPDERAASGVLDAVRRAGGTIHHSFHLPMIRVELDTASVRHLITGPEAIASYARAVPAEHAPGVEAQIRYDRAVRPSDIDAIEQLGGRELWFVPRPHIIAAALPDAAIPSA